MYTHELDSLILNGTLKTTQKTSQKRGNPNPPCNLPKHLMQKGRMVIPGKQGGRPKKTDEQRQRELEEKVILEALHVVKLENAKLILKLQKEERYTELFLGVLERASAIGNPAALKFLNEILGNVIEKEKVPEKEKIQINILHPFS